MTVAANRRAAVSHDLPPAQRLLRAAEELFGESSYRQATVAGICARAGIATGSFYAHFGSKAEIFAAVVRQINADLRLAMRRRSSRRAMISGTGSGPPSAPSSTCCRSGHGWTGSCGSRSSSTRGSSASTTSTWPAATARGVRRAQLAREVDARYDPEVIAYIYTGIGNFIGMRWADWTAGGRVPEDVLDDVLEVLRRGLPPEPAPDGPS